MLELLVLVPVLKSLLWCDFIFPGVFMAMGSQVLIVFLGQVRSINCFLSFLSCLGYYITQCDDIICMSMP